MYGYFQPINWLYTYKTHLCFRVELFLATILLNEKRKFEIFYYGNLTNDVLWGWLFERLIFQVNNNSL